MSYGETSRQAGAWETVGAPETRVDDATGVRIVAPVRNELGEGPLWHPVNGELYWFDILNRTLFVLKNGSVRKRSLPVLMSALGWIDEGTAAVAGEDGFYQMDLATGSMKLLHPLEAGNQGTRSNDGRVDKRGAFWIGTMGKSAEKEAGALYRFAGNKIATLEPNVTIPNATCFSPDGLTAYFCDTTEGRIRTYSLHPDTGEITDSRIFAEVEGDGGPDGAVVDSAGYLWNAEWGAAQVKRYAPDGSVDRVVPLPVSQPTCPAFGGADLKTLYITSAMEGMDDEKRQAEPEAGNLLAIDVEVPGLPETRFGG